MAEDPKKGEPTRRIVSKAPPPFIPVSGRGSPKPPELEATQTLLGWPLYYPNDLKLQTTAIIGEALKKFRAQTETLQLCKYVISKLTPHLCTLVRDRELRADLAQDRMSDLVHSLLVANCHDSSETFRLKREVKKSDEWMKLADLLVAADAAATERKRTSTGGPPDGFGGRQLETDQRLAELKSQKRKGDGHGVADGESSHRHVLDKHSPERMARLTIIRQSLLHEPKMSAQNLCKRLDVANHAVREKWREDHGVTMWLAAYDEPELQKAIQSMLSKDKREIKRLTDLPSQE